MVFFDITNKPFDLKGDELIESATKFLEEADRKKQQAIEEQAQKRPSKTPVASKKKAVPPRWPTPKPDSIYSGLPDEETGSEFRSDTTASSVQAGKTDEMRRLQGARRLLPRLGRGGLRVGAGRPGPSGSQARARGRRFHRRSRSRRTQGRCSWRGPRSGERQDRPDRLMFREAHVRVMWGAEGATRAQRLRSWRRHDEPYARMAHKKALEKERHDIRRRWARAMADGARYRAQEAERQAAADARAAEAAEQRRVQLVADAEARWAALAAEEASTSITNNTAEHADNTSDVWASDDEAVNDDEENDGDNTIFRLIDFDAPRLI